MLAGLRFYSAFTLHAGTNDPVPDWQSLETEAVDALGRYIQVDTTNPPGNEIKAAEFFREIFDREGIESRIIASPPRRQTSTRIPQFHMTQRARCQPSAAKIIGLWL